MSDLTLTIDAAFTDGSTASADSMQSSHWTTPLEEIEDWLQGRVGRDGVGDDNWGGTVLRGQNFQKNSLSEVWEVNVEGDVWGVLPDTSGFASTSQGVSPSPIPGGTLRFYAREAGTILVSFTGTIVAVGTTAQTFDFERELNAAGRETVDGLATTPDIDARLSVNATWVDAVSQGWNEVHHYVDDNGTSTQVVFGATSLSVVAVYA